MQEDCGEFHFTWVYKPALFEASTIVRYAEQFQTVLRTALANPQQPVHDVDPVQGAERRTLLVDWNQTDTVFSQARCLQALVQDQTVQTPDKLALITPSDSFTYKRVNEIANRLARLLCSKGVGSGHYVPLILNSSAELLLAELAVMKTGAAFCPIDPDWPASRIQSLLKQLDSCLVVCSASAEPLLFDLEYEVIFLSDFMYQADCGTATNTAMATTTESSLADPLYCLFTSGSTGDPKGAINQHLGIVNRLYAMNHLFGAAKDDVVLATSSANADALVWQYFWPLISGGRCVVVPRIDVTVPENTNP